MTEPLIDGSAVGSWVNDPGAPVEDLTLVAEVAVANIDRMIAGAGPIPASVVKLAALELAQDMWDQRQAPNGVRMFADALEGSGSPVRVRADATARARAVLRPWLPPTVD